MISAKSIKKSIRQTKPFETLEQEVFLTLLRTTDLVADRATEPIRGTGLTTQQYNVLRILRGAGDDGLQTYQVVERMVTRAPNITRLVDKLERKGFLTRTRSLVDRRVITLRLTEAGRTLLAEIDQPQVEALRAAMQGLNEEENRSLCRLLNRLRSPLEE